MVFFVVIVFLVVVDYVVCVSGGGSACATPKPNPPPQITPPCPLLSLTGATCVRPNDSESQSIAGAALLVPPPPLPVLAARHAPPLSHPK
jgi:hypothetical protein